MLSEPDIETIIFKYQTGNFSTGKINFLVLKLGQSLGAREVNLSLANSWGSSGQFANFVGIEKMVEPIKLFWQTLEKIATSHIILFYFEILKFHQSPCASQLKF